MLPLDVLCFVLANGRSRVVGPTRMWGPPFYTSGFRMESSRALVEDLNLRPGEATRGMWSIFR
jgi:hypothetical protein